MPQYNVPMYRVERVTFNIIAETPDMALLAAKRRYPAHSTDTVLEIKNASGGECDVVEFTVVGSCENCDKIIWEGGEEFVMTDDGTFCRMCYDECAKQSAQ